MGAIWRGIVLAEAPRRAGIVDRREVIRLYEPNAVAVPGFDPKLVPDETRTVLVLTEMHRPVEGSESSPAALSISRFVPRR